MPQDQTPAKTNRRPNLARKRSATDSARTSFLLSPEAVAATEWLIDREGSPKEVFRTIEEFLLGGLSRLEAQGDPQGFDRLLEELSRPAASPNGLDVKGGSILDHDNHGGSEGEPEVHAPDVTGSGNSIRKSFVIGGQTLQLLNKVARRKKIKRDVLVNRILIRRKNSMEAEYKQFFEEQKQAQKIVHGIMDVWDKNIDKIKQLLGEDDPIYQAFYFEYLTVWDRLVDRMDELLETGEPITEPFDTRYR